MFEKFKSRKFLAAIVGVVVGIAMVFGVDADTITKVAGAVTTLASVITYIYTEGKIDAAAVSFAVETIQEAVTTLNETDAGKVEEHTEETN